MIDAPYFGHPFSFFNYIFMDAQNISTTARKVIIEHEQAHILQKHWVDLLISSLVCAAQWFNPFAWLYLKAIKQNHEYLADNTVVQNGNSLAIYQAVLLGYTYNIRIPQLVHSFGYSDNASRFRMMKKTPSNPLRKWTVALIVPFFVVFLWTFSQPAYEYSQPKEDSLVVRLSDLEKSPLIFIDGKEEPYSTINHIDPNTIKSIDVLKDESAINLYGEKAKNGVILITSKK